jgi:hypothetical protein
VARWLPMGQPASPTARACRRYGQPAWSQCSTNAWSRIANRPGSTRWTKCPSPALDSGADPAVVGQWITETQARKLAADARLRAATGARPGPEKMTKEQTAATVNAIRDLMQALRYASTEDKAEIYAGLNLQLTYYPSERMVAVQAGVGQTCTKGSCPRGDLNTQVSDPSPER